MLLTIFLLIGVICIMAGAIIWLALRPKQPADSSMGLLNQNVANLQTNTEKKFDDLQRNLNEDLGKLRKELATFTATQDALKPLPGQIAGLQQILDNKQQRGRFAEVMLENIVRDMMPNKDYKFQHTLSNNSRVDCLISVPPPTFPVPIDAKFPLEAWQALQKSTSDSERASAQRQLRTDLKAHREAIASRYIIPNETANFALMYVGSESLFGDLHIQLPDEVERYRKARVMLVSPNTLSFVLGTLRTIIFDTARHEQTKEVFKLVDLLVQDTQRLNTRVDKLREHFTRANSSITEIETSSRNIAGRGERIATMDAMDALDAPKPDNLPKPD